MRTKPARMALAGVFALLLLLFFKAVDLGRGSAESLKRREGQIGRGIAEGQVYVIAI